MKAVRFARAAVQPGAFGGFQQAVGAHDIGFNERVRARDRPVDMALGREMHDGVDGMIGQRRFDQRLVADIAVNKGNAVQPRQILAPPRIGQGIQHHHLIARMGAAPIARRSWRR